MVNIEFIVSVVICKYFSALVVVVVVIAVVVVVAVVREEMNVVIVLVVAVENIVATFYICRSLSNLRLIHKHFYKYKHTHRLFKNTKHWLWVKIACMQR